MATYSPIVVRRVRVLETLLLELGRPRARIRNQDIFFRQSPFEFLGGGGIFVINGPHAYVEKAFRNFLIFHLPLVSDIDGLFRFVNTQT
jgi:hypothetical protein